MLLIRDGIIHDMEQREPYEADILIRDGKIEEIGEHLAADGVDIDYMYSVFGHKDGTAYMIIAAKNMQTMQASLDRNNIPAADSLALGI